MNFIKFLLIFTFLLQNIEIQPQSNTNNKQSDFNLKKTAIISKLTFFPAIIIATLISHKENLIQNIQQNPILACVGSCLLINFIIDSVVTYQKINNILLSFQSYKCIERYLLYAIAIKNTMQQLQKRFPDYYFAEENYFNAITQHIPLSFTELESFTFDMLHNMIKTMEAMHIKTDYDIEANIYKLNKEHITIEDLKYLYQNDKNLCPHIKKFLQNPIQYYDTITTRLNFLLKQQINYIIQKYE